MRLRKVHVTNFRSVEDSGEFELDHTTCLVGKNESGKTAVLQAIAGLNPHPATPVSFDKERDYPRRYLTEYTKRHGKHEAVIIRTVWELDDEEMAPIESEFGADALKDRSVIVTRRYGGKPQWEIPINHQSAVQHLVSAANFSAPQKSQLKNPTDAKTLKEALQSISGPTEKHQALLAKLEGYPGGSIQAKIEALLSPRLPKFLYFSNYDRMAGEVQFEDLKAKRGDGRLVNDEKLSGERLFLEFLNYAGAPLDDILAASTYESFRAKLQAASNAITDQILEYWSQNPYISVDVAVDAARPGDPPPFNTGTIGRARIDNQLHRVDVPFSERSAGFIWFFSFLIKFAQVEANTVLLLDEPGLTLHGKAQADLLRYFEEKLAPSHQLIYSTHSPFMVDPERLTSARIVEDLVDTTKGRPVALGTKVRADVLGTDPDSIFPLQGALGYEITQSLFIGKNTLLVEGPSDILYLKALSSALVRRGRVGLKPQIVICPSGGIGNIRSFVSLFGGQKLRIGVLADVAQGEKKQLERLRASEVLKASSVLSADQFTGKSEADTEDLFEPELFVALINRVYDLKSDQALTVAKLEAADTSTPRLVKKAEAYFRTLPDDIPTFDHYRPAEWLIENPSFLDDKNEATGRTLDRAEALMKAINSLFEWGGSTPG
jgi:ABC-type transport system involved in cytochrome c biogenesis ATPase subunit